MISIFRKNLAAIRTNDRELAERIENLPPSPRIRKLINGGGKAQISVIGTTGTATLPLHELGRPALNGKAEQLSSARMVMELGFGAGKLFSEIVNRTGEQTFVLLVEPDIDLFAEILREVDVSDSLSLPRVSLAVGEKPHAATIFRAENEFSVFTLSDFPVIEDNWARTLYADYFREIQEKIEQLKKIGEQNALTLLELGDRWRDNILANLPYILKSPPVSSLFGMFEGVPAVIVSAGPSLDKNAYKLAAFAENGVIIAVDTAVRSLLHEGITPDIVVSLDAKIENYFHLAGVSVPDAMMVFNPVAHPKIVEEHKGPMAFAGYAEPLFDWLETIIGERGAVRTGGSVATSALDLAVKLGCEPVTFVGQDLAYSYGKTHSSGAIQEIARKNDAGKKSTYTLGRDWLSGSFQTANIFGEPIVTTEKMTTWRKWFELVISHEEVNALNATEGGMPINGADIVSLDDVIARYAVTAVDKSCLRHTANAGGGIFAVIVELGKARDEARFIKTVCGKGISILKNAIAKAGETGSEAPLRASFDEMRNLSREILTRKLFSELNQWYVGRTLDRVEAMKRKESELDEKDRLSVRLESFRILFSELYETASKFEKSTDKAVRNLKKIEAAGDMA